MTRRFHAFLAALVSGAAMLPAAAALAQYYPSDRPSVSRGVAPTYREWGPPPGFWDDDDDAPVVRRPPRSAQIQQDPSGRPMRVLPYPPDEADASPLPPGVAP